MKVATWNVNGIRAREQQLVAWIAEERPDVLCLQELKASPDQLSSTLFTLMDYWSYWHGARGGYSGVSLHLRKDRWPAQPAFAHPSFDAETRIVQATADGVVYASVYVPNGGKDFPAKMKFLEALAAWTADLEARGTPLVLCGDMNVARAEIDVHPSQRRENLVGQRPEERALFEQMLAHGLTDVGRAQAPDDDRMFTWWPYWRQARERNLGWRLDYVVASNVIAERAREHHVRRTVGTSDHAPVVVAFE